MSMSHYRIMFAEAVVARRMFREVGETLFVETNGRSEEHIAVLEYVRVSVFPQGVPTHLINELERLDCPPTL